MREPVTYLLAAAVTVPLMGAILTRFVASARTVAAVAAAVSLACALVAAPMLDRWSAVPMVLFAALTLGTIVAAPKSSNVIEARLPTARRLQTCPTGVLVMLSSAVAACATTSPWIFLLAWTVSAAAMLPGLRGRLLPPVAVVGSCVLLAGGLLLNEVAPSADVWAFAFIVLAALVRKGVFPFHTWVVSAFSEGPLLPVGLFVNAHFGALLIVKIGIPMFPGLSASALTLVSDLALISAVYTAFVGLAEASPRRLLAFTMLSQASFILSGLESRTAEGIAGALSHWLVVSVAMTGLLVIYSALEARGVTGNRDEYLGLGNRAPRLAVFFAVCALALVGLPGTLGFCAGDLLVHGALDGHPLLGFALPVAGALNAINLFRLFSRLFLGKAPRAVPAFADALLRERLVLASFVLFLVVGGLLPSPVIDLGAPTAASLANLLGGSARQ